MLGKLSDNGVPPDIFIIGSPRSGTYLLSMILNHHFSTAIPLETHFIPLFKTFLPLWGDLSEREARLSLMGAIFEFLQIWTHFESTDRDYEREVKYSLLEVADQAFDIAGEARSYPEMVSGLYRAYARKKQKKYWGDKSAFSRHQPLDKIDRSVLNLHVIHMIRDPRDVSMSWRGIWCGPKQPTETGSAWREHIRKKRAWGRQHPNRYHEIRYEALISDPQSVIGYIQEKFGIEPEKLDVPFWESSFAETLSCGQTHPLLGRGLKTDNKDKWKSAMERITVDLLEYLCWDEMKNLGYSTINSKRPGDNYLYFLVTKQKIQDYLSYRRFQLYVKQMLPLMLFLSRKAGISMSSILFPNG